MGRKNNATAGIVCPADVKAAFNFEFDDIDIDVPLGGTPGRGVQGNSPLARDADPATRGYGWAGKPVHAGVGRQGYLIHPRRPAAPGRIRAISVCNDRAIWPIL